MLRGLVGSADGHGLVGDGDVPAVEVPGEDQPAAEVGGREGAGEVMSHVYVDRVHRQLVGGVHQLPAALAEPVQLPEHRAVAVEPVQPVAPAAAVHLGAVLHRDRPQQAHPEARVAEIPLPVDHDHHHEVGTTGQGHVPDPAQAAAYVVAKPLDHRSEQGRVLEAVAAPLPADELLLDGLEGDARDGCREARRCSRTGTSARVPRAARTEPRGQEHDGSRPPRRDSPGGRAGRCARGARSRPGQKTTSPLLRRARSVAIASLRSSFASASERRSFT